MQTLSTEERQALIVAVHEQYGFVLSWEQFADAMLGLFEDIPGFEAMPPPKAIRIVRKLWSIYHGQETC